MHINLILGLIVVLAVWWLLKNHRENKNSRAEPADMLMDEISKRRAAQDASKRATERLAALRTEKIRPVVDGLEKMARALPDSASSGMELADRRENVRLTLSYPLKKERADNPEREPEIISETFDIEWNIKNFDLELFSGSSSLQSVPGEYIIRMKDGTMLQESDFSGFMRRLSGIIADRLA